jgi:maltodextrin utilization protein YvdJ
MFYKRFILTIFFAAALWPAPINAQISQTTAFTLSVTIPEQAQLPPATSEITDQSNIASIPAQPQIQTEIRDNVLVYLASYVVD